MKVFFDTEFTALSSDPRLLSIGFAAESGEELYIEFSDGWTEDRCSPWVREHVLPLFGTSPQLRRSEACERIALWLTALPTFPLLLGDTDWDTILLDQLLTECAVDPNTYKLQLVKLPTRELTMAFEAAKRSYFDHEAVSRHHALCDARAFRDAWRCVSVVD